MNITLPNGKKIRNIPDGTTKLEIAQKAIAAGLATPEDFGGFVPEPWEQNPQYDAGINPIIGNLQQLGQGVTFGGGEELQALAGAATTTEGQTGMDFLTRYRTIRDQLRAEKDQFKDQEGWVAAVPEVFGGAMTGGSGLLRAGGYKGALGVGSLEGGAAGAGYSEGETAGEIAADVGMGAGIGSVAGPLGFFVGRQVAKVAEPVAEWLKREAPNTRFPDMQGTVTPTRPVPMGESTAQRIARETAEADGAVPDDMARYVREPTPQMQAGQQPPNNMQVDPAKLRKNPLYPKAQEQEIPDPVIAAMGEMSPADKKKGLQMLNIVKQALGNRARQSSMRPAKLLGDTMLDKLNFVYAANRKDQARLKAFVATEMRGKPVDLSEAFARFVDRMDELGLDINVKDSGKWAADFGNVLKLNKADKTPITEVIRKLGVVQNQGRMTADVAHDLKRAIDNDINWDATSKMTPEGKALLRGLRHDINEALRAEYPKYAEINDGLAETTDALKEVLEVAGRRFDIESENAGEYLGQEARKLETNYSVRIPLTDALKKLQRVSEKLGMKSDEDVFRQAVFVNDLEDLFGESAQRGFRGEVRKAVRDAAIDVATQSKGELLAQAGKKALEVAGPSVSPEKRLEVMRQLLNR